MDQNKFEIEFSIKPTKFEIEMKDVVKEIKPEYKQLDITPSIQKQEYKGSFDKVTVQAMENVAPLLNVQDDHINAQTELLAVMKMELIRKGYMKENGGV